MGSRVNVAFSEHQRDIYPLKLNECLSPKEVNSALNHEKAKMVKIPKNEDNR